MAPVERNRLFLGLVVASFAFAAFTFVAGRPSDGFYCYSADVFGPQPTSATTVLQDRPLVVHRQRSEVEQASWFGSCSEAGGNSRDLALRNGLALFVAGAFVLITYRVLGRPG
jgi:hypothetical protein